MNSSGKMLVCLYSDQNLLSQNILETLISKGCLVNIVSDDIKNWEKSTINIAAKKSFAFCRTNQVNGDQFYSYVIFCGGFISTSNAKSDYLKFSSLFDFNKQKSLALFPLELCKTFSQTIITNDNLATIYLGDLIGPRLDLNSDLLLPATISEIINSRQMPLPIGEVFYPVFAPDVARLITKWMFAFGPYGKETLVLGPETSASTFWEKNKKLVGEIKLSFNNKIKARQIPKEKEIQRIPCDINYSLTETYKWISKNISELNLQKKSRPKYQFKYKFQPSRRAKRVVLAILLVLLFPFLTLIIFSGLTLIAYKQFTVGKDDASRNSFQVARTVVTIGEKESGLLSYVPLVGLIYKETGYACNISKELSSAAEESVPMARLSTELLGKILGDNPYDPTVITNPLNKKLQYLYTSTDTIYNTTKNAASNGSVLANMVMNKVDFNSIKNLVLQGSILADRAPNILGKDKNQTYLVLFQNNMELRPTGGFIGSYGLITFSGGRLTDFLVSDVYSADGQLNGHVEPPTPIKEYLGEANWWLRDSNWDPDFPTSAKRAEWFLDKEVDHQVDGVVAIDLYPVKNLLKLTGPIFLADYNLDISSENLYEKVQAEVENNFFPGTHKKASFLTALSKTLLEKISDLTTKQKTNFSLGLFNGFEERHVQMFLHDTVSQDAINALGWDGSVGAYTCGEKCYSDSLAVVEANVGVNKSNYFIERKSKLDINLEQEKIVRNLTLSLKNLANPELGAPGKYKAYIRFLIPNDSSEIFVNSITGQSSEFLRTDITEVKGRKEVGVYVEILGGQSKDITVMWETKPQFLVNSYGMLVRKQAGVEEYPISLNVYTKGRAVKADNRFSLTKTGSYLYNTTLAKDVLVRFSF